MRLIDANKADVEFITCYYANHCYIEDVQEWLDQQPTIEAKPVVHGKWKLHKDGSGTCDQCHFTQPDVWDMDNWDNFCAHCGADMRERIKT